MMADKKRPTGDYEVGRGKPPKKYQWRKGKSGNPKGRPKLEESDSMDVAALFEAPVRVTTGGKEYEMSPFEASFRQVANKAIAGNLPAILKFVKLCEQYGVIASPPVATGGGVVYAPKGVTPQEWIKSCAQDVPVDEE